MKLLNQTLSVLLVALLLQGCQLGTDDEDEEEIDTITISTEYYDDAIDNDNTYELILSAAADYADFTAEDDITEIKIYSDSSYILIDSDETIEEIKIFGDGNAIAVTDGVDLTVSQLTITGDNNSVTVFGVTVCSDSGDGNDVYDDTGQICL
jgi:hypothetical protein